MSEYQYYEFLALDQPLSAEDLAYVRTLSRRVQSTPTQAMFTYSYGDFPGDPVNLLAKHYDVMLYLANWGSRAGCRCCRSPRAMHSWCAPGGASRSPRSCCAGCARPAGARARRLDSAAAFLQRDRCSGRGGAAQAQRARATGG